MLGVVLTVLKIIGFVILGIIALFILLLITPVRYKAKGKYFEKEFSAKAQASYLLHIVSVNLNYDKELKFNIKIFGIPIGKKKKKKISKNKAKDKEEKIDSVTKNVTKIDMDLDSSDDKIGIEESKKEKTISTDDVKEPVTDKSSDKEDKDKDSFLDKTKSLRQKYNDIRDLLEKKSTQDAIATCKDRIGKLLKSILPRKGAINLHIGLENAGITGKIMGAYYALYAYIGKVVHITPYYDEQIIKGDFNLKGHIGICPILYHLACIYFNKNCHRLIKQFIKKEK